MKRTLLPARRVSGTLRLPGDKSISHRYAMLSAIAEGRSEIRHYSTGADCASTLACLGQLGVPYRHDETTVTIDGVGLDGLRPSAKPLDVGNSGSAIRMLSGILAGQSFETTIAGDESIARRPMRRIMTPLREMGASIDALDDNFPPLHIRGSQLRAIAYTSPVASAQVKTAVLFAGLYADGVTRVTEPLPTRNHSEIALREYGATVGVQDLTVSVEGWPRLQGQSLDVPADLSSAAFFLGAALLLPGSDLRLDGIGLNPTRAVLLDVLRSMGASIDILHHETRGGEVIGDLRIAGPLPGKAALAGGVLEGATTAAVIDEIPMLAVLGAVSEKGLTVRDATELRVKETDRIATVADNLRRMGIRVDEQEDGMFIPGGQAFQPGELNSCGDHRIAMAFAVAALAAAGESTMEWAEAASVSFPEFYDLLAEITE